MAYRYRRDQDGDPSPPSQSQGQGSPRRGRREASVSISKVSFEHHSTALGIAETAPRISWRFEGNATDWTQGSYSLEVHKAGQSEPETFTVNSRDSVLVPWPTHGLSSAESATVRVRAHGEGNHPETPWSDPVTVETGLLNKEDWRRAMVIAADEPAQVAVTKQPIMLRKEFDVQSDVASARLYITSYGLYEAYINGQRVGDAVLAPGWQSYSHRLVYDTYDVTNLLSSGGAAIGIVVGEGWYAGSLGWDGARRNIYGDTLGAMALLVVTNTKGGKQTIATDLTWKSSVGPLITAEIYNGTRYDSRLEQAGWSHPGFNQIWTGVKELRAPFDVLAAPDGPPIRRKGEVELQEVLTSPSGKTILDFGQNMVGWLQLRVAGPAGTTVTLTHAEGELPSIPQRVSRGAEYADV
jgi:alpha-L-rhamnosidase